MDIDTFRQQLVVWGITPNVLMFIGILSLFTLFFSVRFVIRWYIGIHHLEQEIHSMRKQLAEIKLILSMASLSPAPVSEVRDKEPSIKNASHKSESFRLTNH